MLSKLLNFLRGEVATDGHATKTLFKHRMASVRVPESRVEFVEEINQRIIDALTVVFGDTTVGTDVFQEVVQGRAVAVGEPTEPFLCHRFTHR